MLPAPTGCLAAIRAFLRMRALQRRLHLIVGDADRELVVAVGTAVVDVHQICSSMFLAAASASSSPVWI